MLIVKIQHKNKLINKLKIQYQNYHPKKLLKLFSNYQKLCSLNNVKNK